MISIIIWEFGCYSFIHDNTLDDIKELNDGVMPEIEYGDDGIPTAIDGKYSNIKVCSSDDAIKSLYSIKSLMKINDPKSEFKLDKYTKFDGTDIYFLDQTYYNIQIEGKWLQINVEEGNIIDIGGDYDANLNLDSTPKITEKEAQDIAEKEYKSSAEKTELVFCAFGDYSSSPVLTWKIKLYDYIAYINAYNRDIVHSECLTVN